MVERLKAVVEAAAGVPASAVERQLLVRSESSHCQRCRWVSWMIFKNTRKYSVGA